jgi:head-tail adaptor
MSCCTTSLPIRLRFERPIYTQDGANEQIATWSEYQTFYGTARAMTSREVVQSEQVQSSTGWILEIPYGKRAMGVTGAMRCAFKYGRDVTAYCDGAGMPVGTKTVKVRAMEQTA